MDLTGFRYRLYPGPEDAEALRRWAGCGRAIYNAGLEQRRTAWRMNWASLSYADQGGVQLTEAKRAMPWLGEPHADVLQQALRDLDRAFARFFAGISSYPKPRRKGRHDRFRIQSRPSNGEIRVRRLSRKWGEVRIPKLGWVRFRWSRDPRGVIRHVTVARDALGWHVSICCRSETRQRPKHLGPALGLDLGVRATAALSTGKLFHCPGLPPGQAQRLRRLTQRAGRQDMARRKRPAGSQDRTRRHQRTLDQIARLRAREARIRRDFLHKLSTDIAKSHGIVVVEDLSVPSMTSSARGTIERPGIRVKAKAGLNRAILAQGWGQLRRQLAYKTERKGGQLIKVPSRYTSQQCAACGDRNAQSRRTQARFACSACGHQADADINAAQNILAAGLAVTARGDLGVNPVLEARTNRQGVARAAA
jgi:putative transposase